MHKRIKLKRKITFKHKKLKKSNLIAIVIIFLALTISLAFSFINNKISPVLMDYAKLELTKFSNIIINNAIANQIDEDIDITELFIIAKNEDGEITTIDFNPLVVNRLLTIITTNIQNNLSYAEQGKIDMLSIEETSLSNYNLSKLKQGIIFEIPSGIIFNNALLANVGPKIPVKLSLVGDIVSSVSTKVTNYGINNAMIEVSINIELSEQIILPFISQDVSISTNVPVAIKLIQGSVPNYYFNGISESSPNVAIAVD
ncbi:MAG: sporulation protein YunB [Bacilli bacterium]|nr:sporulation protein YunB [Bacilli bacterium]